MTDPAGGWQQADQVLVVVSARPGELARLGEGWQRFLGLLGLDIAPVLGGFDTATPQLSARATFWLVLGWVLYTQVRLEWSGVLPTRT